MSYENDATSDNDVSCAGDIAGPKEISMKNLVRVELTNRRGSLMRGPF